MGSSIKKMVTALGLDRIISKTVSALNSSLDGAIERVDTLNNFPRVMQNLGISAEDSSESMNELNDGLIGLPTTLNQGVSAVQRFTSQNGDVKRSTKIFLALNNAILAGGASTDVQASALEQLSQAYAKGKPDALEWRSMLTAMPAQLKQVATYMGYTSTAVGGDLYEAIQKGRISMDDLMDAVINLNDNGVGEFASFSKQAKDSTDGLRTSITNVKTAITRGLANGIDALNESLKKANLPTVNEMIQNLGTFISNAFKKIADGIKKIPWDKITPIIKDVVKYMKNLKDVAFGFIKEVLRNIDWNMVQKLAPTIINIVATFKILNPLIKTGTSLASGFIKAVSNASTIGVAVTVLGTLVGIMGAIITKQTDAQAKAKELADTIKEEKEALDDYNTSVDTNLSKELGQIDRTQALNTELKTLVDENGNVKEGYEDRVRFILNELNSALGTEMELVDGVIQGYEDQGEAIDKLIEKKRAQAIVDAGYEKYQKAIEDQVTATNELNEVLEQMGMNYDEASELVKKVRDALNDGDLEKGYNLLKDAGVNSAYLVEAFENADTRIKTNTANINGYIENQTHFLNGEYDEIKTIVTSTYDDIDTYSVEKLEQSIKKQESNLKNLEQMYAKSGDDIKKQQIDTARQELENLKKQYNEKASVQHKNLAKEFENYKSNGGKVIDFMKSQIPKLKEIAEKQGKSYADGINSQQGSVDSATSNIANTTQNNLSNMNSHQWGADMTSSMASGINEEAYKIESAVKRVASTIFTNLHFSRPDVGVLRNYEKWMPDFVQGLARTLEASTPNLYGAISKMAGKMKEQLSLGFGMSPTLNNTSSFSPSVNVTVQNNMETDFMGNLVSNIKHFSGGSKNDYNYGM